MTGGLQRSSESRVDGDELLLEPQVPMGEVPDQRRSVIKIQILWPLAWQRAVPDVLAPFTANISRPMSPCSLRISSTSRNNCAAPALMFAVNAATIVERGRLSADSAMDCFVSRADPVWVTRELALSFLEFSRIPLDQPRGTGASHAARRE